MELLHREISIKSLGDCWRLSTFEGSYLPVCRNPSRLSSTFCKKKTAFILLLTTLLEGGNMSLAIEHLFQTSDSGKEDEQKWK